MAKDFEMSFPVLLARAKMHLDHVNDVVVLVLKGHLLVEEALEAALEARCSDKSLLQAARLSFHQKLQIARALYGLPDDEHRRRTMEFVWDAIDALNTLRNRLAHKLEPRDIAPLLKRLRIIDANSLSDDAIMDQLGASLGLIIGYVGGMADRGMYEHESIC